MNDNSASTPTTLPTVAAQQTHAAAWCDPTMCQTGQWGYEDRIHLLQGEGMEMSMRDRETLADGTQVAAVVAVFVWQHVAEAGPTLGMWSEGGARGSDAFEIKLTRAEMGRAIEATA